jgi:hypothetical protein
MQGQVYYRRDYGVSINEGFFPNLVLTWRDRRPFFYLAFSPTWKFIFGYGNFRIGPFGAKR